MRNGHPLLVAVLALALAVGGCASTSIRSAGYGSSDTSGGLSEGAGSLQVVERLPAPSVGGGLGQVIRVGDLLKIDVFGVDELDHSGQVDGNGNVTLPLIGQTNAAGLALDAFQQQVTSSYGARYLQNPQITVSLEQTVTLDGEFRKAGAYPVSAGTTLLRAIATAGNFTDIGDPNNVFVYRSVGGRDYVSQYNIAEIRAGRHPDEQVYGGDVVVAFPSGMKVLGSNLADALGLARSATGLL